MKVDITFLLTNPFYSAYNLVNWKFCYMEQKMVIFPQHTAVMLQYCTYIFATILFPYLKQVLHLYRDML